MSVAQDIPAPGKDVELPTCRGQSTHQTSQALVNQGKFWPGWRSSPWGPWAAGTWHSEHVGSTAAAWQVNQGGMSQPSRKVLRDHCGDWKIGG